MMEGCAISSLALARLAAVGVFAWATALPCFAQSAMVRVTHDDLDGFVTPGQTVHFTVLMDWTPRMVLWSVGGDAVASPNIGQVSSNAIGIVFPPPQPGPGTLLVPGTISAGSVLGVDVASGWAGTFGGPPPQFTNGTNLPLLVYDWTAPNAVGTTIDFEWVGRASAWHWPTGAGLPDPEFWRASQAGPFSPTPESVPTTYLGASLTVIPAPSAALALAASLLGSTAIRRRR